MKVYILLLGALCVVPERLSAQYVVNVRDSSPPGTLVMVLQPNNKYCNGDPFHFELEGSDVFEINQSGEITVAQPPIPKRTTVTVTTTCGEASGSVDIIIKRVKGFLPSQRK